MQNQYLQQCGKTRLLFIFAKRHMLCSFDRAEGEIMSQKTLSQKMALAFQIIDYILLIPVLPPLLLLSIFQPQVIYCTFIILILLCLQIALLVAYFKIRRDLLDRKRIIRIWTETIVFNFLLLLPSSYVLYNLYETRKDSYYNSGDELLYLFFVILVVRLFSGVIFPFAAIVSEYERNQK